MLVQYTIGTREEKYLQSMYKKHRTFGQDWTSTIHGTALRTVVEKHFLVVFVPVSELHTLHLDINMQQEETLTALTAVRLHDFMLPRQLQREAKVYPTSMCKILSFDLQIVQYQRNHGSNVPSYLDCFSNKLFVR